MSKPWKKKIARYFYNWMYGLKGWEAVSTNNYGYAPFDPEIGKAWGDEAFQIQLYAEAGKSLSVTQWNQSALLEVGCGRGGGLRYMAKTLAPASVSGLDYSQHAVDYCNVTAKSQGLNIEHKQGEASALPYPDAFFDVVLNVESSHVYPDQPGFLREVSRVLKPGGQFIVADYRSIAPGIETLKRDLEQAGLKLNKTRDISRNVYDACILDSARREVLVKRAPFFIRKYMANYAMTAQSDELKGFLQNYQYVIWKAGK